MSNFNELNDNELLGVNGGSIIFNDDCTMCGLNCCTQCKVIDFASFKAYIVEHLQKDKTDLECLKYAFSQGWIVKA